MHSGVIFTSLLFGLFSFVPKASKIVTFFNVSGNSFGPYDVGEKDKTISVKVIPNSSYTSLTERFSVGSVGGNLSYIINTKSHTATKKKTFTVSLTLPLTDYYSEAGIYGTLEFLTANRVIEQYSFMIKPPRKEHIDPNAYKETAYLGGPVIGYFYTTSSPTEERFSFPGFIDYFNVDYYYRLSLDYLTISYSAKKSFPGCNASLRFIDYSRVFPYIDNSDSIPIVNIPLSSQINGNLVTFSFPKTMYVNPNTLEMSLVARPNFKTTKYFYLPHNHLPEILDQIFTLEVSDFGYSKVSFSYDIRYTNNRYLIGDCNSSDYCVIGEIK